MEPTVHGCALILGRTGVLIRGASGSGKSRLTQMLIDHYCNLNYHADWVADDRVILTQHKTAVVAKVPRTLEGLSEQRYGGVVPMQFTPSAVIDLAIDLVPIQELDRMPRPATVTLLEDTDPVQHISVPKDDLAHSSTLIVSFLQRHEA